MHILMLIVLGHLVLAAFVLAAGLINRGGNTVDGARPFIWVWLLISIANGVVGVVQAGIPDVIPVEACYLGWQESLEQLAKLVEPEIPG